MTKFLLIKTSAIVYLLQLIDKLCCYVRWWIQRHIFFQKFYIKINGCCFTGFFKFTLVMCIPYINQVLSLIYSHRLQMSQHASMWWQTSVIWANIQITPGPPPTWQYPASCHTAGSQISALLPLRGNGYPYDKLHWPSQWIASCADQPYEISRFTFWQNSFTIFWNKTFREP